MIVANGVTTPPQVPSRPGRGGEIPERFSDGESPFTDFNGPRVITNQEEAFRHTCEDPSQPLSITQGLRQRLALALEVKDRSDFPQRCERASEIEPEVNCQLKRVASLWEMFERTSACSKHALASR